MRTSGARGGAFGRLGQLPSRQFDPRECYGELSREGRRVLEILASSKRLPSTQVPHEAATRGPRATSTTHLSWPDDEEEQRQQHSDGHAADVDAVLPVAPPARKSNVTRRPRARRDVVPVTASARWRGGSRRLRTNSQDNLAHWSSSTPSLTNRGRPRRARRGRIRSSARCNRHHLLRHKAHCSSERERPSVRDSRRLDAAACVTWVPAARQRSPAGRRTTRTASFMTNGTKKTTVMCSRCSARVFASESLLAVVRH